MNGPNATSSSMYILFINYTFSNLNWMIKIHIISIQKYSKTTQKTILVK